MSGLSNYLQGLSDEVDKINTCEELLAFKHYVEEKLNKIIQDNLDHQSKLKALSIPPVDLATTINWIKNQIDLYILPAIQAANEVQEVAQALITLTEKIISKANILQCDWSQ